MKYNQKLKRGHLGGGYYEVFNFQCGNCKAKYGTEPNYCHACLSTNIIKIKPCND